MRLKYLMLFLLTFVGQTVYAQLAQWSFDESTGGTTLESITNASFVYFQGREHLERVKGVAGQAFRPDGYSTWLEGEWTTELPPDIISLSSWIALESYPVKTAAIFSLWNTTNRQGLEIGINKFGQLAGQFNLGNGVVNICSEQSISHYQWALISLSIDGISGEVKAYLNEELVINQVVAPGSFNWPTELLIAKSKQTQKQGPFDLNVINGIIDELELWDMVLDSTFIADRLADQPANSLPDLKVLESRFEGDYLRPQYHPIPHAAWTNESHGLIYYQDQYHMFSQKNLSGPFFANQNWGHFVSEDLINWREVQPALWPENQYDSVGTWSGHLILDDQNVPIIYYTGVDGRIASIHQARPLDDSLSTWAKTDSLNPLIAESPFLNEGKDFRDPFVFRENESWYMIIGSGTPQNAGTLPLYKSDDLETWTFQGSLFTGNPSIDFAGSFWEMPVFWKFGNKYVLMITRIPESGNLARALYWVGDFINDTFVPDETVPKNFEIINGNLSPAFALDAEGQVVCIGIIPDEVSNEVHYDLGWANTFSLPRLVSLDESTGNLIQQVHPNIDTMAELLSTLQEVNIIPGQRNFLNNLRGFQYEIKVSFDREEANRVGLVFGASNNRNEQTRIYYDYNTSEFGLERINSTLAPGFPRDNRTGIYPLQNDEKLNLRIFIDGSVVEVYVNEKAVFSGRYFPSEANHDHIDLFAEGGRALASRVEIFAFGDSPIPTSIENPGLYPFPLKIYPNPTANKLTVELGVAPDKQIDFIIQDMQGKIWDHRYLKGQELAAGISLRDLPQGQYLVILKQDQLILTLRRLLIQK